MNRYYIDVMIAVDASNKKVALKRFNKLMKESDLRAIYYDLSDIHPIGVEKLD